MLESLVAIAEMLTGANGTPYDVACTAAENAPMPATLEAAA